MGEWLFLLALALLIGAGVKLRKTALGVGILSGLVAGFVMAGMGGRLVMRVIAVVDPNTTPGFTLGGTLFLVVGVGAMGAFLGGIGGAGFVGLRRWLPGRGAWLGLIYGSIVVLSLGGPFFWFVDQDESFSDFEPALLGVALFFSLGLAYGAALGATVERLKGSRTEHDGWPWTRLVGLAMLGALCALGGYYSVTVIAGAVTVAG